MPKRRPEITGSAFFFALQLAFSKILEILSYHQCEHTIPRKPRQQCSPDRPMGVLSKMNLNRKNTMHIARTTLMLIIACLVWAGSRAQSPPAKLSDDGKNSPAIPGTGNGEEIAAGLGWHELPGTQLASRCPDNPSIQGNSGCRAVINAWNGGIADTKRNRLIVWGGGHNDYFGNEVYALDLKLGALTRITEPSVPNDVNRCPEAYEDGHPNSRHTYNGLAYMANVDQMFAYGGGLANCGFLSTGTWSLDLNTLQWQRRDPHKGETPHNTPGVAADYDPNSGMVFLSDTASFYEFNPSKNAYRKLGDLVGVDYHLTAVIDPERKLFFLIGGSGQMWTIDIGPRAKFGLKNWASSVKGCENLVHAPYPGLAYDSKQKKIVGWTGGSNVTIFDPETKSCAVKEFSAGPAAAQPNGTLGRFRYFPEMNAFALVNDWKQNAYLLRLTE